LLAVVKQRPPYFLIIQCASPSEDFVWPMGTLS
jgi:hypothetical protein